MMKKMNKKSIMAIVFAAMFVFASVAGIFLPQQASAVGKRGKIRTIKVTSVKKLTVGKRSKIKVKVAPKKVAAKVTYKSSNKTIATVNRKGVVKAKRPGRVTITVKAKSKNTKIKRIKIRVIPKKTSKKKKKQTTSKNTTKRNDTSSGNNGSNNSGKNDNDGEDETPSYETALDKKTSADGVLTLSRSDLKYDSFFDEYNVPSDFTKAKTVVLPEGLTYSFLDDAKENITYVFRGKSWITSSFISTSNEEVINNLRYDQKGTENWLYTACIVGNGVSKVTLKNGKKFTIVIKNFDEVNTLRYQCRKVVNEITNNAMTDKEKVSAVLRYISQHSTDQYVFNIGTYHVNTDCTGFSATVAQMLNFAGVDCCTRLAGYDRSYGQTPTHQNNLAYMDGEVYIVEEGGYFLYSDYFDKNNCYIGYNSYYDKLYPDLGLKNKEGQKDVNIEQGNITWANDEGYNLILKKAGRL